MVPLFAKRFHLLDETDWSLVALKMAKSVEEGKYSRPLRGSSLVPELVQSWEAALILLHSELTPQCFLLQLQYSSDDRW